MKHKQKSTQMNPAGSLCRRLPTFIPVAGMVIKKAKGALFILCVSGSFATASAEEVPDFGADTLSGDWGGMRSRLWDKGIAIERTHKSDYLSNTSGGVQRGSVWLANTEAAISVDLGKHIGWNGTSAFIQYHAQHGNQPKDFNGSYVGSFAGVDNIETGNNAAQFFQAWLQKNLADDSLSVLAGLYAIDSEFYVTDTSGLFLQPPYGMSAEMAQTGQNGPPIFPMGALAVRVKYSVSDFYIQGVLSDGVPGNPAKPSGTYIKLDKGDGTLSAVELGYKPANEDASISKTSIGLWNYTAPAADMVTGEPRSDRGAYLLAERTLMAEEGQPGQGLFGFVRYGMVNKDVYQADWSGSVGLHYQGLLDGRDDDEAGIAVTTSHASDKYRQLNASDSSETVIELTYRAQILPWMAVQPSVQRIINPNMNMAVSDASVVGVRVELAI